MPKLNYRGRPSSLTEETRGALLFAIRRGLSLRQSCDYAGIAYVTLRSWLRRAEKEEARLEENSRRKPYKRELPYLEFKREYEEAIADSLAALADTIKLAADGGHTSTEQSTRVKKELKRDPNTGQAALIITEEITTETVKVSLPDWRAALAMLERRDPENWGRRQLLEHIGDPDRPVASTVHNPYTNLDEGDLDDRIDQLSRRIEQKRKNRTFTATRSEDGKENGRSAPGATDSEKE